MLIIQGIAAFFTFVATFLFVYWIPFSILMSDRLSDWLPLIGSLSCAALAAMFVWRSLAAADRGFVASVAVGAALVGTVGFIGGFFGPMLFAPGANQGPLLGLFITGPGGFLLGAIGGAGYRLMTHARE
jgi:hypothetical protein